MYRPSVARKRRPPRYGLLVSRLSEDYQGEIIRQSMLRAADFDAQIVVVDGGALNEPVDRERWKNYLYNLIDSHNFDGLIVLSLPVGQFADRHSFDAFLARFEDMPIVSVGVRNENTYSILTDNYSTAYSLVTHLIETHGKKRLACIKGTEGNAEAEERFAAYRDALAGHGIDYDETLVYRGTFDYGAGSAAVAELLDERHVSFDALVACDDITLLGAMDSFAERGISVPDDVAVTGYDDLATGRLNLPALSTASQPYAVIVEYALIYLTGLREGRFPLESCIVLPSRMMIRRSCGCGVRSPMRHGVTGVSSVSDSANDSVPRHPEPDVILATIRYRLHLPDRITGSTKFAQVTQSFVDTLISTYRDDEAEKMSDSSSRLLAYIQQEGGDPSLWRDLIDDIYHLFGIRSSDIPKREGYWVLLREVFRDIEAHELMMAQLRERRISEQVVELSNQLIVVRNESEIRRSLKNRLLHLGVRSCLVVVFGDVLDEVVDEDPDVTHRASVLLGYDGETPAPFDPDDLFPRTDLLPGTLDTLGWFSGYLLPLVSEGRQYGYVLMEQSPLRPMHYVTFSGILSHAIRALSMRRLISKHTEDIERTIERRTQELTDANEALRDMSYRDVLTGLHNRRYLMDLVAPEAHAIKQSFSGQQETEAEAGQAANRTGLGLIMVDLDWFKHVNDRHGHIAGDFLLKQAAGVFLSCVRKDDVVIRWGGEEFLIVLRRFRRDRETLVEVAENIRHAISAHGFAIESRITLNCTCSIGCLAYPLPGTEYTDIDFDHALSLVDNALYAAKRGGRNRTVLLTIGRPEIWKEKPAASIISGFAGSVAMGAIDLRTVTGAVES